MVEYINTPNGSFTNNEYTGQTAEEVYQEYLKNKEQQKIDICPAKTTEDRLDEIDTAIENLQAMYFEILMEV